MTDNSADRAGERRLAITDSQESEALESQWAPLISMLVVALLAGLTYVLIDDAVERTAALSFTTWRLAVGGVMLLALAFPRTVGVWRDAGIGGALLALGFGLQAVGLTTTTASHAALLGSLTLVAAPILAALWKRLGPPPWTLVAAVIAGIGIMRLSFDESFRIEIGDLILIGSALALAVHVVFMMNAASRHRLIPFVALQLVIAAGLVGGAAAIRSELAIPTGPVLGSVALTGIGVTAISFLMQVWASTRLTPHQAAVALSTAPVFGVVAAMFLIANRLDARGAVAAVLIVAAVQLSLKLGTDKATDESIAVSPAR